MAKRFLCISYQGMRITLANARNELDLHCVINDVTETVYFTEDDIAAKLPLPVIVNN